MKDRRTVYDVGVALAVGVGLTLGLLYLLSLQLSLVKAAPRRDAGAARFEQAPGAVITVCQGGGCDHETIQGAVDAANAGDEIRVAAGTYTDVNGRGGLAQLLYLDKTVTIRGGYTTTDWTTSDPETNPTTLDAQGQGRVLYVTGDIDPTVSALRITGGSAEGLGGPFNPPAADAGGGVYSNATGGSLSDSWVFSNTADAGGGIYVGEGSRTMLTNNSITANVAASIGGGLTLFDTRVLMQDNRVEGNRASYGGGMYLVSNRTSALVRDNQIVRNQADWGAGLYLKSDGGRIVSNDLSSNTAAGGGGGLVVHNSTVARLDANNIVANVAQDGGGIYLWDTQATLVNTVIADNEARGSGSAIYVLKSRPRFIHTTVARHSRVDGARQVAGVAIAAGTADFINGAVFTNTILVSQPIGVHAATTTHVSLEGTLWGAGAWANGVDWRGLGTILTGTAANNVWGPPAFVAPQAGDYHITVDSAAIDRGVSSRVASDVDDQPRPIPAGGRVDLGADESTGIDLSPSSKSASPDRGQPGDVITYQIALRNRGYLSAERVALVDKVPSYTAYLSGSAYATSGVLTGGNPIRWSGTVSPQRPVTLTFAVTLNEDALVENTALITDAYGTRMALTAWVNARHLYMPFLFRNAP